MKLVLARRAIAQRRRWLVGWSIGITAYIVLNIAFWPSLRGQADEMNEMLESMPESLRSLFGMGGGVDPFSPVGYLSAQVYALSLPLLLIIAAVGLAGSLAGDEEHGLLETTYTLPVRRAQVVAERWLALVALTGALAVVALVAVSGCARAVDLDVDPLAIVWATLTAVLLTWAIAAIGLAVAEATGRRSLAITVAVVVAVASYVITSLADAGIGFFEVLEPVSLFSRYDVVATLSGAAPIASSLVLVAVTCVGVGAAMWAIDRRDLRAG